MTNLNDLKILVEIPLDADLDARRIIGRDEDGDPIIDGSPVTVADAVLDAAARLLEQSLLQELARRTGRFGSGASDLYDEKLKARVEALLDSKIEEQFQLMLGGRPATAYSSEVPARTLEEYVGERVDRWLKQAAGDGYNKGPSRLEQAVAKVIDRELTKALTVTMADARARALDAVAGVAQTQLAEALRQSIAGVARQ